MAAITAVPLFLRDALVTFKIGAGSALEYQCHVSEARVVTTQGDTVTIETLCASGSFANVGKPSYALKLTGVQDWDTDKTGFAAFLWNNAGALAQVVVQAHGEAVAISTDTPAMTGEVRLLEPDYGGTVSEYATFELELPFTSRPTLDTTP